MKINSFFICLLLPQNDSGCQIFDLFYGAKPRNKNNRKMKGVARIMLEYKLEREIRPGHLACHHCDVPRCMNLDHIYEGTHKSNAEDKVKRNRSRRGIPNILISLKNRSENNHFAKITAQEVVEIRKLRDKGMIYKELAAQFNLAPNSIRKICRNTTWAFLPHCSRIGREYKRQGHSRGLE